MKYKPKSISELAGNKSQVERVIYSIEHYKKPILITGPPGCGKTVSVELIGKKLNREIINLNSDEMRDYQSFKDTVINSSTQMSLFRKKKMIVIDEAETISSLKGLNELIKVTKSPIILIVNDAYKSKLRSLIRNFEVIKYYKIRINTIENILKKISLKEGVEINEKNIKQIALNSDGDLRAAILDLESMNLEFYRNKLKDVFNVLGIIFKSSTYSNALDAIRNSDKDLRELKWWIEENIPNEYEDPEEISKAFEILSYEDLMESRIMKRQYWGFSSYMYELLAAISLCKKKKYKKFVKYSPPKRFSKNKLSDKEMFVLKKYAEELHISIQRFVKIELPILRKIILKMNSVPKEDKDLIKKIKI